MESLQIISNPLYTEDVCDFEDVHFQWFSKILKDEQNVLLQPEYIIFEGNKIYYESSFVYTVVEEERNKGDIMIRGYGEEAIEYYVYFRKNKTKINGRSWDFSKILTIEKKRRLPFLKKRLEIENKKTKDA